MCAFQSQQPVTPQWRWPSELFGCVASLSIRFSSSCRCCVRACVFFNVTMCFLWRAPRRTIYVERRGRRNIDARPSSVQ